MLDQNTDRMWYVIGAIVIGAAIIAMGLNIFNESFDSVEDNFGSIMGISGDNIHSIGNSGIYSESEIDQLVAEGYIPIATAEELDSIRKDETLTYGVGTKWERSYSSGMNKKYIQVSDIDLKRLGNFEPIGSYDNGFFNGIYDGGGFTISNLTNDSSKSYLGLFGFAKGSGFININIVDAYLKGDFHVGGIVGSMRDRSIVTNSSVSGKIIGNSHSGGLVGYQVGSEVYGSYSSGTVSGLTEVGGLIGVQSFSSTYNSYSSSDVTGPRYSGGLVGVQGNFCKIENSYATGDVFGGDGSSGLVGLQHTTSEIINSYSVGYVDDSNALSGLLGSNGRDSKVINSYYDLERSGHNKNNQGGFARTSLEMKDQSTYVGWNFDNIWQIDIGQLPTLQKE